MVAPVVGALLPSIVNMVPELIRIFGKSPQAEKNAQAAEKVAEIVTVATGSTNVQQAVERMERDQAALSAASQAIHDNWFALQEVGGGVEAARKWSTEASKTGLKKNPAFWMSVSLLPLVYMTVSAVIFNLNSEWPSDTRTMVVSLVVGGVLGAITGFWLGSSMSSRSKDEALQERLRPDQPV